MVMEMNSGFYDSCTGSKSPPVKRVGRYLMESSEHFLVGFKRNLGWEVFQTGAVIIGHLSP